MPVLKQEHPELYKSLIVKAVVHIAYGSALLFLPSNEPRQVVPPIVQIVNNWLDAFGLMYFVIGILLVIGLYLSRNTYSFARAAITIAAVYSVAWCLIFIVIFANDPSRSIAFISVGFFYFTYRLIKVRRDPGWKAIDIVREMRDGRA